MKKSIKTTSSDMMSGKNPKKTDTAKQTFYQKEGKHRPDQHKTVFIRTGRKKCFSSEGKKGKTQHKPSALLCSLFCVIGTYNFSSNSFISMRISILCIHSDSDTVYNVFHYGAKFLKQNKNNNFHPQNKIFNSKKLFIFPE